MDTLIHFFAAVGICTALFLGYAVAALVGDWLRTMRKQHLLRVLNRGVGHYKFALSLDAKHGKLSPVEAEAAKELLENLIDGTGSDDAACDFRDALEHGRKQTHYAKGHT
jgi:hypothetical protein